VDLFEQRIAEYTGSKYAVSCVNGTSALQVALQLAGVQPGDEVIVPTLTFIATVNAVAYNGASPVFMDADRYYNLDAEKTIHFIQTETNYRDGSTYNKSTGRRIAAILPVHVWGNAAWLDELVLLCEDRGIVVVEDASESLGTVYRSGKYTGRHTGTIGRLGCLSFNGNKTITTGGGGMVLTEDEELAEKTRYLTTQAKDDPVRYVHHEIGYNFRLTNIQAALGVAQLEMLPGFLERKRKIYRQYLTGLKDVEGLGIAEVPENADNNHWMNVIQIDSARFGTDREGLMDRLEQNGIETRPVWALNHMQKPYRDCQTYQIVHAKRLVKDSLCLPSSTNLSDEDIQFVNSKLYG
jgi:aminotransferase in exopolysaccharide biosynthesis